MRVAFLAGVRISLRYDPRHWSGEAPRVVTVYRVDDAGTLEQLPIERWPGTNAVAVHVGNAGWVMLAELTRFEYADWEPPAPPPPEDTDALDPWLHLYPKLIEHPRRPAWSFER